MIVHHHLIYQAEIYQSSHLKNVKEDILKSFLIDLISEIEMELLIPPVLKFSEQKAWTGLVGIITSHISFHFWTIENYVQLDIYSCKEFSLEKTISYLNKFWDAEFNKILFIKRNIEENFEIQSYTDFMIKS